MIAQIAVSAANFTIDKPYSYAVPTSMLLQPGQRVMVPFGRSNRRRRLLTSRSPQTGCGNLPFLLQFHS